jgi:hypothetical protein
MNDIYYLGALIALIALLIFFARDKHTWRYYNPYNRSCQMCGRHEVSHCRSVDSWGNSWWEVFDEGDGSCTNRRIRLF